MSEFITVAKVEEIPPGTGKTVDVNGVWIALFNVDGSFVAVDNTCPHAGGPIGEGSLSGDIVTCPWHGWQFNIRTGQRDDCEIRRSGSDPALEAGRGDHPAGLGRRADRVGAQSQARIQA